MRHIFSYVCLLLLVICCWHCMARHIKDKSQGSDSDESSASRESKAHSHEHGSSSHKHKAHSHEHGSSSHEHGSSSHEHGSSSSKESPSKEEKSCRDGKQKGDETDIDCGGKKCQKCAVGKICKADSDCSSGICKAKKCAQQPTTTTKRPTTTTGRTTGRTTAPPTTTGRTTAPPTTTGRTTAPPTTTGRTTERTTALPTTTTPETEETTATVPETEETTSTAPETEEATTAAPETEETTAIAPETEETTAIAPETEEATTAAPETEETTAIAPETEETTAIAPEIEETTATAPETEVATAEALGMEAPTTTSPTCEFECKNGGTCTGHNECTCSDGFSGETCEVQSVGLCLDNETFDTEPLLLITFGSGSDQYSSATPASFNFSTTYRQGFAPQTHDGMFSFINSVNDDFHGAWHTGAIDHSEDDNGYMYLVNADYTPGQFYDGIVDNLCVGLRYEFSVYLANLCKAHCQIKPNVLFEVRSVKDNTLLAQLESGDVEEYNTLTWKKYGFSFVATSPSVNLLMTSNAPGGGGNDLVIDDIALRVCANKGNGFCPSN